MGTPVAAAAAGAVVEKATDKVGSKIGKVFSSRGGGRGYPGLKAEYVAAILLLLIWPLSDDDAINTRTRFGNWARQMVALTLTYAILIAVATTGRGGKRLATMFGLLILLGLMLSKKGAKGAMLGPEVFRAIVRILSPRPEQADFVTGVSGKGTDFAAAPRDLEGGGGAGGGAAPPSKTGGLNQGASGTSRRRATGRGGTGRRGGGGRVPTPDLDRLDPRTGRVRPRPKVPHLPQIRPDVEPGLPNLPGRLPPPPKRVRPPVVAPPRAPARPRRVPHPSPGPVPHP